VHKRAELVADLVRQAKERQASGEPAKPAVTDEPAEIDRHR